VFSQAKVMSVFGFGCAALGSSTARHFTFSSVCFATAGFKKSDGEAGEKGFAAKSE
jgi:hypothetical protein